METKLVSTTTWYKCLFCTRIFPQGPQLIEHRKLQHALEWKERKLAKYNVTVELEDELDKRTEKSNEMAPHPVGKTRRGLGKRTNFKSKGENNRLASLNIGPGTSSKKKKGAKPCTETECKGNCERSTTSSTPNVIIASEDSNSAFAINNPVECEREVIEIEMDITGVFDDEIEHPEPFNAIKEWDWGPREADNVPEDKTFEEKCSTGPTAGQKRKSARLVSQTNLTVAKMMECIFRENDFGPQRHKKVQIHSPSREPEKVKTGRRSQKAFSCSICNKKFREKNHVDMHEVTHSKILPHKCNFCPKRFAQKGNLKTHEMIHTGELPFQCKLCDRKFRTNAFLSAHKIVHTDDRNFDCTKCGLRFRTKGILKTHYQSQQHKDK